MKIIQSDLTFDEENHRYFWKGREVPSVSQILKTTGLRKDWDGIDPFYAERGKAVHRCIELFLQSDLDESSIDEACKPFFDGFRAYWQKNASEPYEAEIALYSESLGYAGTIDLVDVKIGDWKCSKSHDPVAEIQGALYRQLVLEVLSKMLPFEVIQLPGDGTYSVIPYAAPWKLGDAALELYHWKIKRGQRRPRHVDAGGARSELVV